MTMRRQGWTICFQCREPQTPDAEDALCDRPKCRLSLCRTCRPQAGRHSTVWCPSHRPPGPIPRLGWTLSPIFHRPGRDSTPDANREAAVHITSDLPPDFRRVASLSITEDFRWRVVLAARRLATWARSTPDLTPTTDPIRALAHHVHHLVRCLSRHPIPMRRVQRPSTPETWVRLLSAGYHDQLAAAPRHRMITSLMKGYHALAPGPTPTTTAPRGLADQWQAAMDHLLTTFLQRPQPVTAAAWLALEMTRQGLRPKAAIRAAMTHSQRTRHTVQQRAGDARAEVFEIRVHIDKDNPLGKVSAWRRRWLPVTPMVVRIMRALPCDEYQSIFRCRRDALLAHGVPQVYAGRRDAAARAEELEQPVEQLLNHRPGSKSTPGYTGSVTASSLLRAMLQSQTPQS